MRERSLFITENLKNTKKLRELRHKDIILADQVRIERGEENVEEGLDEV
jgi:hypothetical protein